MNAAEMKTIRESLGLTAQWFADQVGVKLRTVQYWEAGRGSPPTDAIELLNEAQLFMDNSYKKALKEFKTNANKHLVRYRNSDELWEAVKDFNATKPYPVTFHSMLLARIRNEVFNQTGRYPEIQYSK